MTSISSFALRAGLLVGLLLAALSLPPIAFAGVGVEAPTITSAPTSPNNSSSQLVWFSVPDNTHAECALDGAEFSSCSSPLVITDTLADGQHTVLLHAVSDSSSGHSDDVPVTWLLDLTAPAQPLITSGPADASTTTATQVTFGFIVDGDATVSCRLDDADYGPCDSATSQTYSDLAEGAHLAWFRARDTVGNTSFITRQFVIDLSPPPAPTFALTPPSEQTANEDGIALASFAVNGSYDRECAIDDADWDVCQTQYIVGAGVHTLRARQRDNADRLSPEASYTWTVHAFVPPSTNPVPNPNPDPVPNPNPSPGPSPAPGPAPAPGPGVTPSIKLPSATVPSTVPGTAPGTAPGVTPTSCIVTTLAWKKPTGAARKRYSVKGSTATIKRPGKVAFAGNTTGCAAGTTLPASVRTSHASSTLKITVGKDGRFTGSALGNVRGKGTVKVGARSISYKGAKAKAKRPAARR